MTPKTDKGRIKWVYISPSGNKYHKYDKTYELFGYHRSITVKCPQTDEVTSDDLPIL